MIKRFIDSLNISGNTEHSFRFIAYSFLFTFCLLLAFLFNAGSAGEIKSMFYSLTIPLYYYLLFSFLVLICLPLLWFTRFRFLILVPKILFDVVLIGDYFLFGVFRFHVDMMFINMLIYDFKGIGISLWLVGLSVLVTAVVVTINVWIYRACVNWRSLPLIKVNLAIFVVFLTGQMIHAVGYEYRQVNITKYTPYFPYYAPLTSNSLMAKLKQRFPETFPKVAVASAENVSDILSQRQQGLLAYPKSPMQCVVQPTAKKPNILFFVAESWRQDVFDDQVTPNIYAFSQQAVNYQNHYSGGSVTVNGLFTLMFGLHPTYRDYMTSQPLKNQTLLTKVLAEQGYDIDVYTSSNLDRFSLKPLFFGAIEDEHYVNPMNDSMKDDDFKAVSELIDDLKQPNDKPWFKFVFLSSSHHNYQYPEQYARFSPVEKNPEKFLFHKDMDPQPLFNRYKNSVHYIDGLFGDILQAGEQSKVLDNAMVVVTSDHGEEFNDNGLGYWGHGSNFTKSQIAVPLFIQYPSQFANAGEAVDKLSAHVDLVPTVLRNVLGCTNPTEDYSTGQDLLNLPENRAGIISASYKDKAYLINDMIYATGLTTSSYHVEDMKQVNENYDYSALNRLKQQESSLLNR